MATNPATASGVLLAVAVALAVQVPTTVQQIPDTTTRSVVMVGILVVVVVCSVLVRPREVATMVVNSLRPPPSETAQRERTSILPPKPVQIDVPDLHGFELDDEPRAAPTPHDTPNAKAARKP